MQTTILTKNPAVYNVSATVKSPNKPTEVAVYTPTSKPAPTSPMQESGILPSGSTFNIDETSPRVQQALANAKPGELVQLNSQPAKGPISQERYYAASPETPNKPVRISAGVYEKLATEQRRQMASDVVESVVNPIWTTGVRPSELRLETEAEVKKRSPLTVTKAPEVSESIKLQQMGERYDPSTYGRTIYNTPIIRTVKSVGYYGLSELQSFKEHPIRTAVEAGIGIGIAAIAPASVIIGGTAAFSTIRIGTGESPLKVGSETATDVGIFLAAAKVGSSLSTSVHTMWSKPIQVGETESIITTTNFGKQQIVKTLSKSSFKTMRGSEIIAEAADVQRISPLKGEKAPTWTSEAVGKLEIKEVSPIPKKPKVTFGSYTAKETIKSMELGTSALRESAIKIGKQEVALQTVSRDIPIKNKGSKFMYESGVMEKLGKFDEGRLNIVGKGRSQEIADISYTKEVPYSRVVKENPIEIELGVKKIPVQQTVRISKSFAMEESSTAKFFRDVDVLGVTEYSAFKKGELKEPVDLGKMWRSKRASVGAETTTETRTGSRTTQFEALRPQVTQGREPEIKSAMDTLYNQQPKVMPFNIDAGGLGFSFVQSIRRVKPRETLFNMNIQSAMPTTKVSTRLQQSSLTRLGSTSQLGLDTPTSVTLKRVPAQQPSVLVIPDVKVGVVPKTDILVRTGLGTGLSVGTGITLPKRPPISPKLPSIAIRPLPEWGRPAKRGKQPKTYFPSVTSVVHNIKAKSKKVRTKGLSGLELRPELR